jgi:nucleoside-diphosphate-sugar epimerase
MMLERFPVDKADFDGPVLITGAGGCIGSWATALLVRAGVPVVVYDLSDDQRRPRLLMTEDQLARVTWVKGDISDTAAVAAVVAGHRVRAIIHLAALQVPFCKADPVAGARANVVGTVNVLEAARAHGLKRVAYASSIAALSFFPDAPWLDTLYGAYKLCNEMTASVYFQDWGVPSVGIRPGVVYGVARDQGLTSKTTIAILAAAAGRPYTVPFTGAVSALHAGEVASAFIRSVSKERNEARVFDLNGRATSVAAWLDLLHTIAPGAQLSMSGAELPFPADLSDAPVEAYLGDYGPVSLEVGIRATYDAFKRLLATGALSPDAVA